MKDYYETLGVAKDATPDDIKKAYRRLAAYWHPDKNDTIEAKSKFQEISEAYQTLHDPAKRQEYDFSRSQAANPFSFQWQDILARAAANERNTRIYRVRITIEQAYTGAVVALGRGINAVIPPGTAHNSKVSVDSGFAIVSIVPDSKFKLATEKDLVAEFEIDTLTAIVGTTIRVTLPNNEALVVKVPPLTKQGQMLRITGKGIPVKNAPGSLFLVANLVPPTGLTDEQIAAIVAIQTPTQLEI